MRQIKDVMNDVACIGSSRPPCPHVGTSEDARLLDPKPRVGARNLLALARWLERCRDEGSEPRPGVAPAAGDPAAADCRADRPAGPTSAGGAVRGTGEAGP